MTFDVAASSYGCFMGRFSEPLAVPFLELVHPRPGQRALDVGCGPGALTGPLVELLGAQSVAAIDPSPPFVAAVAERWPGVDVRTGTAEQLPFADASFDLTLAQLVVHFMPDPVAGIAEMARVTRPGGWVAACVWDLVGDRGPLSVFWTAARRADPRVDDESGRAGGREGQLAELAEQAGLAGAEPGAITSTVSFASFAEWWEPFTLGVGPAGAYVASLDAAGRTRLRQQCQDALPAGPFTLDATAWCMRARLPEA